MKQYLLLLIFLGILYSQPVSALEENLIEISAVDGRFYPEMIVLIGFAMLSLILNNIISMFIFSRTETITLHISHEPI